MYERDKVLRMHQSYMSKAFGNLEDIQHNMLKATEGLEYDTLVGTGLSGALVIPTLARQNGLHWAIVRKEDGTHSGNLIEGEIGQNWIFVDDLICSGRTLKKVVDTIKTVASSSWFQTTFVGSYEYQGNNMRTASDLRQSYLS